MKSRVIKLRSLLASVGIVLGIVGAQAQTINWTNETPTNNGTYYLFNNGSKKFVKAINNQTTTFADATMFTYGTISDANNPNTLSFNQNGRKYLDTKADWNSTQTGLKFETVGGWNRISKYTDETVITYGSSVDESGYPVEEVGRSTKISDGEDYGTWSLNSEQTTRTRTIRTTRKYILPEYKTTKTRTKQTIRRNQNTTFIASGNVGIDYPVQSVSYTTVNDSLHTTEYARTRECTLIFTRVEAQKRTRSRILGIWTYGDWQDDTENTTSYSFRNPIDTDWNNPAWVEQDSHKEIIPVSSDGPTTSSLTFDDSYSWRFITQDQYNAIYPTLSSGVLSYDAGETFMTEKVDGVWYAKTSTDPNGNYMNMTISGLSDKKYYNIVISAKKTGSGDAVLKAESNYIIHDSKALTNEMTEYSLFAKPKNGEISLYVEVGDGNAGSVYVKLTSVSESSAISGVSFWTPEVLSENKFYLYNEAANGYLKAVNELESDASLATEFVFERYKSKPLYKWSNGLNFESNPTDVYEIKFKDQIGNDINVSLDDTGNANWSSADDVMKYWIFEEKANTNYAINSRDLTVTRRQGTLEFQNSRNRFQDVDHERYLQATVGGITYPQQGDINAPYTYWQFISPEQYQVMCPTNFIKEQLGYNSDRNTVAWNWVSDCGATVKSNYMASKNGKSESHWIANAKSGADLPLNQDVLSITITGLLEGEYNLTYIYGATDGATMVVDANGTTSETLSTTGKLQGVSKNSNGKYDYLKTLSGIKVDASGRLKIRIYLTAGSAKDVYFAITGISCKATSMTGNMVEGKYYVRNAETGDYIDITENGVSPTLTSKGNEFYVEASGSQFKFNTQFKGYYNGTSMDAASGTLYYIGSIKTDAEHFLISTSTIERNNGKVDKNISGCLGEETNSLLTGQTFDVANPSKLLQWQFLTFEQRKSELSAATISEPKDATFLMKDYNFMRKNSEGAWDNAGTQTNTYVEKENNFEVYQILDNVPNGLYVVSVKGVHSVNGDESPVVDLIANDYTSQIKNVGGASYSSIETASLLAVVTDHTLRIGVKSYAPTGTTWFDDFELIYYGQVENDELEMTYVYLNDPKFLTSKWNEYWTSSNMMLKTGGNGDEDPKNSYSGKGKFVTNTDYTFTKIPLLDGLFGHQNENWQVQQSSLKQQTKVPLPAGAYKLCADVVSYKGNGPSYLYAEVNGRQQRLYVQDSENTVSTRSLTFVVPSTGYVTVGFNHDYANSSSAENKNVSVNNFKIYYLGTTEETDITCQIINSGLKDNSITKVDQWTGTGFTSLTNKPFDTYQTVKGLPDGWYRVTANGYYNNGSSKNKQVFLYGNDASTYVELGTTTQDNEVIARVKGGNLKMGVTTFDATANGTASFENFKLHYLYADIPVGTEVTQFIKNPSFETGSSLKWTTANGAVAGNSAMSEYDGNFVFNANTTGYTVSQTISGLPRGYYSLSAYIESAGSTEITVNLKANCNLKDYSKGFLVHKKGVDYDIEHTLYGIEIVDGKDLIITASASSPYYIDHFVLVRNDKVGSEQAADKTELNRLIARAKVIVGRSVYGNGAFQILTSRKTNLESEISKAQAVSDKAGATAPEILKEVNELKGAINSVVTAKPNNPVKDTYYSVNIAGSYLGFSANRRAYMSPDVVAIKFVPTDKSGIYCMENMNGEYLNLSSLTSSIFAVGSKNTSTGAFSFAYYWDESDNPRLTLVSARNNESLKVVGKSVSHRSATENGDVIYDAIANYGSSSAQAKIVITALPKQTCTIKVTKAMWATMLANVRVPGLDAEKYRKNFVVYKVVSRGRDNDKGVYEAELLVLEKVSTIEPNKPYLVHSYVDGGVTVNADASYQYPKEKEHNLTNGLLVGNYQQGRKITGDGTQYLLQKQDDLVAFYKAKQGSVYQIAKNSAFLKYSNGGATPARLRLVYGEDLELDEPDEVEMTDMEDSYVVEEVVPIAIFNLRGVRISSLEQGYNIVKFSDGTTRKVFLK